MKKMKKILAMVLAMAMVLGMSVTAFAELAENQHEATGTSSDTGTITVEGIDPEIPEGGAEPGITVTAYQIIKAKYGNNGTSFIGYESLYPNSLPIALVEDENSSTTNEMSVRIEQENLNAIIGEMAFENGVPTHLAAGTEDKPLRYAGGKYSADGLAVGSYLVVVSIFYVDASQTGNTTEYGSVNVQDGNAWVKVSGTPDIDKTSTPQDTHEVEDYDDTSVHVGDVIDYQVLINPIPYYGGEHPVFKLTDTLSEGLELVGGANGITVKKATVTTEGSETTVTPGDELD